VTWIWYALAIPPLVALLGLYLLHRWIIFRYLGHVDRIFQEKPLFIIPFGKPVEGAEEVHLKTPDGVDLCGCYLKAAPPRKGVILFGLEFGSNRWSCVPYTEFLVQAGYDIFAFETRGQGDSGNIPDYEPLQWVTDHEIADFRTAVEYLKRRPDADPNGIGLFGLSKGGSAGLYVAADDPYLRCFVTDGVFDSMTTMVPYMQQWCRIYTQSRIIGMLPRCYFAYLAGLTLRRVSRQRKVHYDQLAEAMPRLSPRPLLMIHGGGDNYIKPEMAREIFDYARDPKEFWLVPKAKHNQAFHLVNEEYKRRVLEFFDRCLAGSTQNREACSEVGS
jgi:dipeptidyl aminopeptidase/acylaminoacyl peptidase